MSVDDIVGVEPYGSMRFLGLPDPEIHFELHPFDFNLAPAEMVKPYYCLESILTLSQLAPKVLDCPKAQITA